MPCSTGILVPSDNLIDLVNVIPGTFLLPIGLLIGGWAAQEKVFWLVPNIVACRSYSPSYISGSIGCFIQGFAFVGAGIVLIFQGMQTYVIDAFTTHAASGKSRQHGANC